MKKMFIIMLMLVFASVGANAIACEGPECENYTAVDIETDLFTPELNLYKQSGNSNGEDHVQMGGVAGYSHDIRAAGSSYAFANGEGKADMYGFGGAFQKEINGGELSGAGGVTIATGHVTGYALGVDSPECNNGDDFAKVDLTIKGTAYQFNNAYSDDKDSFIGGGNFSRVDYEAQTDKYDLGKDDLRFVHKGNVYKKYIGKGRWMYKTFPVNANPHGWRYVRPNYGWVKITDLDAEAYDVLGGVAITGGGTLVYAKNTNNSAFIGGVTGNFATAMMCGAENVNIDVQGNGIIGGAAQLPNFGYAGFTAEFNYAGKNFGAGVAGGVSSVNTVNTPSHTSVTSSTTAFAGVVTGGGGQPD